MTHASFIRYYISDEMPNSLAWQIQNLLPQLSALHGWQWIPANQFEYKGSFGYPSDPNYVPSPNDLEIECIMRRCSAIIEHHDHSVVVESSLLEVLPSPATIIDDILMLCSIAKCMDMLAIAQEVLKPDGSRHIGFRLAPQLAGVQEVVPQDDLGNFIKDSLAKLQQGDWKEDVGFIPAIIWYAQAQRSFRAATFGLVLSLYWISLEILSRTYIQNRGLLGTIQNKKNRVKKFTNARGFTGASWGFLDAAIDDWYAVRNAAFHEGNLPVWSEDKFEQRGRQLAEFSSFVLADMLQEQSPSQKDLIAARLSNY